jgi:hypothetical protein
MTDTTERFKPLEELSPDEHLKRMQARNRGEPEPEFERPEYTEARRKALKDAGLEDEAA